MTAYRNLIPGDPAPWFRTRAPGMDRFEFSSVGGRYVLLAFFGSAANPAGRAVLSFLAANRSLFDDDRIAFFGVSLDPRDEAERRVENSVPGIRWFWDFDAAVSRLYGVVPDGPPQAAGEIRLRCLWYLLDPTLRVLHTLPIDPDRGEHAALGEVLRALPPADRFAGIELQAPILYLPNVFPADFCRALIELYEARGGSRTGVMRQVGGKTVEIHDGGFKRRSDLYLDDEGLMARARGAIVRAVVPEIHKVHQFRATRLERYLVACYDSADGGHFRAHRDNTTAGTAHRRFAVSINLNREFEGGEVCFPEYGARSFKPPPGAAVVFSCSLLHAVSRVTSGRRYAFLPFLYDEEAAKIRDANQSALSA